MNALISVLECLESDHINSHHFLLLKANQNENNCSHVENSFPVSMNSASGNGWQDAS